MLPPVNFSLLLTTLLSYVTAYRARQNFGLAGYEDPYGLSNALGAIELQRRQFNGPSIPRYSDEFGEEYLSPDEIRQSRPSIETLSNQFARPYYAESYPYPYDNLNQKWNSPQKRTAYHPHRVVPSVDELRKLFASANLPVKRVVPVKRRYFETGMNNNMQSGHAEKKDINTEDILKNKELLTDRMRQLINAAEEKQNEKVVTETKTVSDENGPVEEVKEVDISETEPLDDKSGTLTEKLVEVFEDAMSNDDNQNADNGITDDGESDIVSESDTLNLENDAELSDVRSDELQDLISKYLSKSQSKSKRASSTETVNVEVLLNKIAQLKDELSSVQVQKALEDKENDYLSRALKYATLDQLSEGDEFMTKEYEDIVKATETEELLQMLSRASEQEEEDVDLISNAETDELEAQAEQQGLVKKRDDFNEEGWYDTPVTEKVVGGAELQDPGQGSEFPIDIPYPDDSEEEEADDLGDDLIDETQSETGVMQGQDNQLLHRLLAGMTPEQLEQLSEEFSENEPDSDVCPAVMDLSTNCAFTDRHGILLDEEARNLCNRHEMCYKCGPTIGLSQAQCDQGYENTVIEACEGDVRCLRSAILFLKLMQGYHSYPLISSPRCQQPCVERFVYEGD